MTLEEITAKFLKADPIDWQDVQAFAVEGFSEMGLSKDLLAFDDMEEIQKTQRSFAESKGTPNGLPFQVYLAAYTGAHYLENISEDFPSLHDSHPATPLYRAYEIGQSIVPLKQLMYFLDDFLVELQMEPIAVSAPVEPSEVETAGRRPLPAEIGPESQTGPEAMIRGIDVYAQNLRKSVPGMSANSFVSYVFSGVALRPEMRQLLTMLIAGNSDSQPIRTASRLVVD